ncbi:MAG TPA: response regulator [Ktedonobacterales bacterium]|nr:response regulator [Ktedonobacterales bacterium]
MFPRAVLVIDDEEIIRGAVRLTLEDVGYEVVEAPNGRVGLDLLRASRVPMVVLLDLMMPGGSGLEFLTKVHSEPELADRHVFIIFTAARAFAATTLLSYVPGKPLYNLPKPFAIDELIATVEEAATMAGVPESAGT